VVVTKAIRVISEYRYLVLVCILKSTTIIHIPFILVCTLLYVFFPLVATLFLLRFQSQVQVSNRMSHSYGGQKETKKELEKKVQELNLSVMDLFDWSKPWVLVPNGSILGFFDWVSYEQFSIYYRLFKII
jgi:hypothetical protein